MGRFENDVLGLVPAKDWLNVGFDVTRPNDPIDSLFGDQRTENLIAEWESIASEYQIPSMAQFHSFDVEAQTTVRVPIDAHNIEKGLIKAKLNQSERLRALMNRGVREDALYDYVMDDGFRLAEQVFTRSKVAKNELLATGKVTIKENGLDLTVDYGVPADATAFELDLATTADISGQIRDIVDAAMEKGAVITGIVTSRKNITKMRRNAGLQAEINGNVGAGQLVRSASLEAYLSEEFGINTVITNDQIYSAPYTIDPLTNRPKVEKHRYFPEDKVTFIATNNTSILGVGLWGNPPEMDALDLRGRNSADFPYVYISQWSEKDPAVIWTKASALFMPVLYNPDSLFIATVKDSVNDATAEPETDPEGA